MVQLRRMVVPLSAKASMFGGQVTRGSSLSVNEAVCC
jgi:hypothetical protein